MTWSKKPIHFETDDAHYISFVFSWDLWDYCVNAQPELDGKPIIIGGPAVYNNRQWIPDFIKIGINMPFLQRHNKNATRTTIGCIRKCKFCAVPKIEPDYKELKEWEIKPILIDNNFLACSKKHFDIVIDKLKKLPYCEFNQGLDARLLTDYHASRLAELNIKIRLAFDSIKNESEFIRAAGLLDKHKIPKKNKYCYILIGYDDTPADALHRLELVSRSGFYTNPMRYQPLNAKQKNEFIAESWTEKQLKDYMRYWSNMRYFAGIPFEEYQNKTYKNNYCTS